MIKPELIKAGDTMVKLGHYNEPPKVDIRIVSDYEYQIMIMLLEQAERLIKNPGANISSSEELNFAKWHIDYDRWKKL